MTANRAAGMRRALVPVTAVLAATGIGLVGVGVAAQQPAPPSLAVASPGAAAEGQLATGAGAAAADRGPNAAGAAGTAPADSASDAVAPLPPSQPVRVTVPRLGIDSSLIDLGLNPDRTMQTPQSGEQVGWYKGSPAPGSLGPATLAGHVTWSRKPAVFFRLAELKSGDRVEVTRRDGRTAVFSVELVEQYPKDAFPTEKVYADLPYAGLRLITCGGEFDSSARRYLSNVVAYARLVDVRSA